MRKILAFAMIVRIIEGRRCRKFCCGKQKGGEIEGRKGEKREKKGGRTWNERGKAHRESDVPM